MCLWSGIRTITIYMVANRQSLERQIYKIKIPNCFLLAIGHVGIPPATRAIGRRQMEAPNPPMNPLLGRVTQKVCGKKGHLFDDVPGAHDRTTRHRRSFPVPSASIETDFPAGKTSTYYATSPWTTAILSCDSNKLGLIGGSKSWDYTCSCALHRMEWKLSSKARGKLTDI